MLEWRPVPYENLTGWREDDHLAALACFRMSARGFEQKAHVSRQAVETPSALFFIAQRALELDIDNTSAQDARYFFEKHFQPMALAGKSGFVTAYFEPEVAASRDQTDEFSYPLLRRPEDLVKLDEDNRSSDIAGELEFARKTENGLVEYFDRGEIDSGALKNRGLELFWLKSAIEGFYIHVQGSARLILTDGSSVRVSYAGKTGHPYTSIGKLLVDRGIMQLNEANMVNIRAWLEQDHDRAMKLLHENRSFIFFTEVLGHEPDFGPIAAAGVQLTPGRSLAVDKDLHAYGTPVWLSTKDPLPSDTKPFRRLMVAQDTGSAIVGPKRGDIFIGSGKEAGIIAGSVRHSTEFIVLYPRDGE